MIWISDKMEQLSHIIRKFNRFELKYMITLQQAERFKSALRAYLVPDEHGKNNGHYALASLYYDSPDFRCYHEKDDGIKFRRKLRIRRYESDEVLSDETPVFVEIKQRIDRVTQKRRVCLPYQEALHLCNDRKIPDHEICDRNVIEEIYVFTWQYNLRPVSIVRYKRQAFIGTDYDIGLRVTFDTDLTVQTHRLRLHESSTAIPMLPADRVVVEIKVNERMPRWLTELIAAHNLNMVRISKYCRSIHTAQNLRDNQWQHLLAERTEEVLSTSFSVYKPIEHTMAIGGK